MLEWSDGEELSGRKAFDVWRFTEADRAIPWDWADMTDREKGVWIDRARAVTAGRRSPSYLGGPMVTTVAIAAIGPTPPTVT